jgi:uncharacterized Fe-S center protein
MIYMREKRYNQNNNKLRIQSAICDFCGTCVAVCPVDCIELTETEIEIDFEICIMCMNCLKACPIHIISEVSE